MARRTYFTPQAREDVTAHVRYIRRDSMDAAARFRSAVRETCQQLAANSNLGQIVVGSSASRNETRIWPVQGFRNHLVFYQATEFGIAVIRVVHGARDWECLLGS